MTTDVIEIITKRKLNSILEKDDRYIEYARQEECEGLLYSVYTDTRNGKEYAVREIRSLSMGFNSNEDGKVDEFITIVEREGACKAFWGVTGRTMHLMLAQQLAAQLPQYEFELDYDLYKCIGKKRTPELVPMPGTTTPDWGKKHWGPQAGGSHE